MAIKKTITQRGGTKLKDKEQPAPKRRGRPRKAPGPVLKKWSIPE